MTKNRILLLLMLLLSVRLTAIETDSLMRQIRISILTCAPGQELYSLYGHNAIRIQDASSGSDIVYNYGTFDFDTPNFAVKFMRGRLPYLLSASTFFDFLQEYEYFERAVVEQELQLSGDEKRKILAYLSTNMLPENRAYQYDFFYDNCATRLRDIINAAVPEVVWPDNEQGPKTYRQIIKEYQKDWPWTDFGIDLIIGARADVLADVQARTFIPDYLDKALTVAHQGRTKVERLQYNRKTILDYPKKETSGTWLPSPFVLFCILLFNEIYLLMTGRKGKMKAWLKWYDHAWVVILTLAAILMSVMWFGTDHQATKDNWNMLWANPLWMVWAWRSKFGSTFRSACFGFLIALCLVSFVNAIPGMQILPQYFHWAVAPVCALLILKLIRQKRI